MSDEELDALQARIAALEAQLATARNILEDAAGDLTEYVDAEYPAEQCGRYPHMARCRERDWRNTSTKTEDGYNG
jgi:hypothetical protein